jgi:molybdopterin converting factor small subunit
VGIQPTSAGTSIRVGVLAFARVREVLGSAAFDMDVPKGSAVREIWHALCTRAPQLVPLEGSTRVARNGRLAAPDEIVEDGDELALLPPVGGG